MLVTTIWVLFVSQSFAKDLVPHTHQQILNENVETRARMAYYDSPHLSNPHYKINFIYEQKKTNEVTEIEQIEEEIGKYMHHHHQPHTTTTTTEAQPNIEIVNEKDIKENTNHSPSEIPIPVTETHHHKHEEKEVTSTLAPMPPAPKLREPFIAVHPHFPTALPAKIKKELKKLLAHDLRRFPHRHPDHRLLIPRTTFEAPHEVETRTELSPPVTQSDEIPNNDDADFPHRRPNHQLHISRTTSEAPLEVETRTELSPPVTLTDEMPINDVAGSHSNHQDSPARELRPIPRRQLDNQFHVSQTTSEASVEEETQTELSPFVEKSEEIGEISNYVIGSHLDRPDSPVYELRPTLHRHPDHRLHISRSSSEAPVEVEVQTELSPLDTQWEEMKEIPISDVPESHVDRSESPAHEKRPHGYPFHRLHISRTTSEAHLAQEARTELSPIVTQSNEIRESPVYELRPISHRHPDRRLHISRSTSEAPVEVEARTNYASTEKPIQLSPMSHDQSFLNHKDQNSLAKIRPKFEDVQGSIGLPSRPRPVYRGSYKFSWDDINDMHTSSVPKVSQLKENPNPPVPTLSPWYDGYGK